MSYFSYDITQHLLRPSTVTTNTEYPIGSGNYSKIPTSLFDGEAVNLNFFNLAKSAVDNTTRIVSLESNSVLVESSGKGYISYNGRKEGAGFWYGGDSLVIPHVESPIPPAITPSVGTPFVFNSTTKYGFQISASGAIKYSNASTGSVDDTTTLYTEVKLDGTSTFGAVDTYATATSQSDFVNYVKNALVKSVNTSNPSNRATIVGTSNPASAGNYASTWGAISALAPKSFYVYWNDGYSEEVLYGTTSKKAKVTLSAPPSAQTNVIIANTLDGAIKVAIGAVDSTVTGVSVSEQGTSVCFVANGAWQAFTPRSLGGVYEITLGIDAVGDSGSGSLLEWLGWVTSPNTKVRVYDYTKVLDLYFNEDNQLVITGSDAYIDLTFKDGISSIGYPGFFSYFGTAVSSSTAYFHSMKPLTTWNKQLNLGGNLAVNGVTSTGTSKFLGPVTFSSDISFSNANISVPGGFNITPSYPSGTAFPIYTAVSMGVDGRVYPADKSNGSLYFRVIGIAVEVGTGAGAPVKVLCSGKVTNFSSGLVAGDPVFMYTSGALTQNNNLINNGEYRQVVGVATSSTDIMVSIEEPSLVVDPGITASVRSSYKGILTTGAGVNLKFQLKEYDTTSSYSTTDGYYTVPTSGIYLVNCAFETSILGTTEYRYTINIITSGGEIHRTLVEEVSTTARTSSGRAQAIVSVAQGELISVTLTNAVGTISTTNDPTGAGYNGSLPGSNYLQITRLGA